MLVAVQVLVGLLLVAGLAGSVLPFVPGTPLILAGAFLYALATAFTPIGVGRLLILVALAVLAWVIGYAGAALGAKKYGGSRWAVIGALLGAVVGVFFGPLGLLLGSLAGAVFGELVRTGNLEESARNGFGALAGVIMGAIAHFTLALVMVGLFLWWVWRG